jgi:hypothetical protein
LPAGATLSSNGSEAGWVSESASGSGSSAAFDSDPDPDPDTDPGSWLD